MTKTELMTFAILIWAMALTTMSYILAFFGVGFQTNETLSSTLVNVIIATFYGYCLKEGWANTVKYGGVRLPSRRVRAARGGKDARDKSCK